MNQYETQADATANEALRTPRTVSDQQATQHNEERGAGLSLFVAACSVLMASGVVTFEYPTLTIGLGTVLFYMLVRRHSPQSSRPSPEFCAGELRTFGATQFYSAHNNEKYNHEKE